MWRDFGDLSRYGSGTSDLKTWASYVESRWQIVGRCCQNRNDRSLIHKFTETQKLQVAVFGLWSRIVIR